MPYKRILQQKVKKDLFIGKVIVIVGPRQVGKTFLVNQLLKEPRGDPDSVKEFNCDRADDRDLLSQEKLHYLESVIGNAKYIFIDEGQKVNNIGNILKILVEKYRSNKQIIVTGSSSLNLLDHTGEPLTGRKFVHKLFPLSLSEIYPSLDFREIHRGLEQLLLFGVYPEVASQNTLERKQRILEEISSSYLYRDVLELEKVKSSTVLQNLLKALALQVGSEVSIHELANLVGLDVKTVNRYIDLFEKSFVVFRLPPYYQNKRKEISKSQKIFFYDLGVRNSLISNFNPLDSRDDVGRMWENFMVVERLKMREYLDISANQYFWKTYGGAEVDLVEERGGKLYGYEFKWKKDPKKVKAPKSWADLPKSEFSFFNSENFVEFLRDGG